LHIILLLFRISDSEKVPNISIAIMMQIEVVVEKENGPIIDTKIYRIMDPVRNAGNHNSFRWIWFCLSNSLIVVQPAAVNDNK